MKKQAFLLGCIGLATMSMPGCSNDGADNISLARSEAAVSTCVTVQRGGAGNIFDTEIASNRPHESYGHLPVANVGMSGGGERQTLLRADLSDVPAGVSIQSAILTLWQSNTGDGVVNAHEILVPWDEATVTWGSLDGGYSPESAISVSNGGKTYAGPVEINVTGLVQKWVSGVSPNHGILLEQSGRAVTRIRTGKVGNAQHRPRLEVCYTEAPTTESASLFVQVLMEDPDGEPIQAMATVTVGGERHATDGAGRLLLENLTPGRFAARVEARGFAPASVAVMLPAGSQVGTEVRLLRLGEFMPFEAAEGADLVEGPVRVTIPPNALVDYKGEPVVGWVEATMVPFNPSTMDMAKLPGPLEGISSATGATVDLESFAMAEVSLWQDGLPVHLAPGATATLELLLPDSLAGRYQTGDTIPAWWLDVDAGIWRQEGEGTIQTASSYPDRLAWVVEVSHFTWWNCDAPWYDKNCFDVTVVDGDGNPVAKMAMGAEGVSYEGRSISGYTQDTGHACVNIKLGGTADILAGLPSAIYGRVQVTGTGPASSCDGDGDGAACTPVMLIVQAEPAICTPGDSQHCAYTGPAGTDGIGLCQAGTDFCNASGTAWSGCMGEVLPQAETCATPFDDDCDGQANELDDSLDCECGAGETAQCYSGHPDTLGVGICQAGIQTCDTSIGRYGACMGQVLPQPEICEPSADEDCNGTSFCMGIHVWSKQLVHGGHVNQNIAQLVTDVAGNVVQAGGFRGSVNFGGSLFSSQDNSDDIYVVKLGPDGQHLWSKSFGGSGSDHASAVAVDGAGNIIIAGKFSGTVDFGGGPVTSVGYQDIFVVKLGADGQHVWSRGVSMASFTTAKVALSTDSSGNIVVTGGFAGTIDFGGGALSSAGNTDIFLVKLDPSGQHLWGYRFGDPSDDVASIVAVDDADNIVVIGRFTGSIDLGGGLFSGGGDYVAKFDPNGQHTWSRHITDAAITGLAVDGGGNVAFMGKLYVVKLDSDGQQLWRKSFAWTSFVGTNPRMSMDRSGNVIFTGSFIGTIDFGGDALTNPGNPGSPDEPGLDIFAVKLDSNGVHKWSKVLGDEAAPGDLEKEQFPVALAVDSSGNVLLSGRSSHTGAGGSVISLGDASLTMTESDADFLVKLTP